jgi:hypothetical protein
MIEFATGHGDGTACVWLPDGGSQYGDDEKIALSASPLEPEDARAGRIGVSKRHMDILGDVPSCISSSADGRRLV